MKVAVTTGARREIIVKEMPTPSVLPGTLLLKTKYCSICGSDLHYLDGGYDLHAGAILGHEFSAEVAAVGEGVEGWSVGDRVTMGNPVPCGQCYFCRRRLYHFCMPGSPRALLFEVTPGGYGNTFGAMAEYFVRTPTLVQKVPDSVSDEEATLVKPLTISVGGIQKVPDSVSDEEATLVEPLSISAGGVETAGLRTGDSAVVIGAGKIGLGAMLCAKVAGAAPVIVIDVIKSRLDKALEMGADAALNANEVDVISEVVKLTEAGPDAAILCVRNGKVLNQAVEMVRRGGVIVIVGLVPPVEVNPARWLARQVRVETFVFPGLMDLSMHLIAQKQVNVKPLVTEIIPLEEVQRAFDSMYSGENIVALLKP